MTDVKSQSNEITPPDNDLNRKNETLKDITDLEEVSESNFV